MASDLKKRRLFSWWSFSTVVKRVWSINLKTSLGKIIFIFNDHRLRTKKSSKCNFEQFSYVKKSVLLKREEEKRRDSFNPKRPGLFGQLDTQGALVTQPMLQLQPNQTELRLMVSKSIFYVDSKNVNKKFLHRHS